MEAFAVLIFSFMLLRTAFSEHKVCSWVIGVGSPLRYGFDEFCVASIKNNTGATAEYHCPDDQKLRKNLLVADWGKLAAQVLEWGTPCAHGGYGRNETGDCLGSHWAMCIGSPDNGQCYGMASEDDCQWPNLIAAQNLPAALSVFYHTDPEAA